jgi:hypothetical protein
MNKLKMKELFPKLLEKCRNTTIGKKFYNKPIGVAFVIHIAIGSILAAIISNLYFYYERYDKKILLNYDNDFLLFITIIIFPILYNIVMNYIFKFYDFLKFRFFGK